MRRKPMMKMMMLRNKIRKSLKNLLTPKRKLVINNGNT